MSMTASYHSSYTVAELDIARSPYFKIESSMRLRPGCFAMYNVKAIAPSIPMSTLHTHGDETKCHLFACGQAHGSANHLGEFVRLLIKLVCFN